MDGGYRYRLLSPDTEYSPSIRLILFSTFFNEFYNYLFGIHICGLNGRAFALDGYGSGVIRLDEKHRPGFYCEWEALILMDAIPAESFDLSVLDYHKSSSSFFFLVVIKCEVL